MATAKLIAAHPETPVVINHTFLPVDRSAEGLAGWRKALARAASAPQTSLKISGLGVKGRPWTLDDNRAVIRDAIEIFGPDSPEGKELGCDAYPKPGLSCWVWLLLLVLLRVIALVVWRVVRS